MTEKEKGREREKYLRILIGYFVNQTESVTTNYNTGNINYLGKTCENKTYMQIQMYKYRYIMDIDVSICINRWHEKL